MRTAYSLLFCPRPLSSLCHTLPSAAEAGNIGHRALLAHVHDAVVGQHSGTTAPSIRSMQAHATCALLTCHPDRPRAAQIQGGLLGDGHASAGVLYRVCFCCVRVHLGVRRALSPDSQHSKVLTMVDLVETPCWGFRRVLWCWWRSCWCCCEVVCTESRVRPAHHSHTFTPRHTHLTHVRAHRFFVPHPQSTPVVSVCVIGYFALVSLLSIYQVGVFLFVCSFVCLTIPSALCSGCTMRAHTHTHRHTHTHTHTHTYTLTLTHTHARARARMRALVRSLASTLHSLFKLIFAHSLHGGRRQPLQMFGSNSEYYFKHLAGLQQAPQSSGWAALNLRPAVWSEHRNLSICANLSSVNATLDTPRGLAAASWSCGGPPPQVCPQHHQFVQKENMELHGGGVGVSPALSTSLQHVTMLAISHSLTLAHIEALCTSPPSST
jgi:hypothetical protein